MNKWIDRANKFLSRIFRSGESQHYMNNGKICPEFKFFPMLSQKILDCRLRPEEKTCIDFIKDLNNFEDLNVVMEDLIQYNKNHPILLLSLISIEDINICIDEDIDINELIPSFALMIKTLISVEDKITHSNIFNIIMELKKNGK